MNILHMKYAAEVAKAGSINKAAENLLIAQPNLSRAIKELEADLGIVIFDRSSKGMSLTADGEVFIRYAQRILNQIDDVERIYKSGAAMKQRFSISVPRASYISQAFARFSLSIADSPAEIFYKETNAYRAIKNMVNEDYKLGIIRYAATYDRYFSDAFAEKNIAATPIAEFNYVLAMSKDSPLALKENIRFADLKPYIEIAHGDPFVPSLPTAMVKKEELGNDSSRQIFVFERASQFELLSTNVSTYMWVSPIPAELLERYGLVQKRCFDNKKLYKDVLIRHQSYKLTELDQKFIAEVFRSQESCFNI